MPRDTEFAGSRPDRGANVWSARRLWTRTLPSTATGGKENELPHLGRSVSQQPEKLLILDDGLDYVVACLIQPFVKSLLPSLLRSPKLSVRGISLEHL